MLSLTRTESSAMETKRTGALKKIPMAVDGGCEIARTAVFARCGWKTGTPNWHPQNLAVRTAEVSRTATRGQDCQGKQELLNGR